jgi:hypothetical protein
MAIDQAPPANSPHPSEIDAAAQVEYDFITAQGVATKDEIRAYCKEASIPTAVYQKGFERLSRQLSLITEITTDDGKKGWAVKDWARGMSLLQAFEVLSTVGTQQKQRENYGDWLTIAGVFHLTSPALASNPDPADPSRRVFLRAGDQIILSSGYYQAMFERSCQMPGAPMIGSARYRVQWDQQMMPESITSLILRPVPPSRPGGSGQGVTSCESLAAGTEVPFSATIPGSHVGAAEFEALLNIAGRWVGFSPSASHKGFGRYTPEVR